MNKIYLRLIELVRRVLKEDNTELNIELFPDLQDINMWKELYNLATAQEVQVFLYEATKNLKLPELVQKNFYSVYNRAVRKEAIMHLEVSNYFEKLSAENIAYLPVKGWKLKHLYSKPYLRTMTDVDLIVRADGFERARQVAGECGFELDTEGENHHVFVKKPVTELEVHHQLFSKKSPLHQWGREVVEKTDGFSMSDEDAYVYLIAHMAKHFSRDGAGMRNIVDCYLFNKKYSFDNNQQEYIYSTLKSLGLDVFEQRISGLAKVWFDGESYDSESEQLTEYIMDGGLYGKTGNGGALKVAGDSSSKLGWFMKELFPDFDHLKLSLKYKKMYKILTPVYWVIRIVRGLFHKGSVSARTTVMAKDEVELNKSKQILDYMGLKSTDY